MNSLPIIVPTHDAESVILDPLGWVSESLGWVTESLGWVTESPAVASTAQGGGARRVEGVAARIKSRGSEGAGVEPGRRRRAGSGEDEAEARAAGPRCVGRVGRRAALRPPSLLGRVRADR
jgi:hypothetical protein